MLWLNPNVNPDSYVNTNNIQPNGGLSVTSDPNSGLSSTGITDITTGLALETNATANASSIVTILNALNDIAPSEVLTQVTNALNTYDAPTKAELDAGLATVALTTDLAKLATKGDLAALD